MNATRHWRKSRLAAIVAGLGVSLTACASNTLPASVSGGECKLFAPPDYAIRGLTKIDQAWIDDTEEAGIAGCKWSRPKARPTSDKIANAAPLSIVPAAPPVKKHWWQRVKK